MILRTLSVVALFAVLVVPMAALMLFWLLVMVVATVHFATVRIR